MGGIGGAILTGIFALDGGLIYTGDSVSFEEDEHREPTARRYCKWKFQGSQRGGVWSLSEWSSWAPLNLQVRHPFVTPGCLLCFFSGVDQKGGASRCCEIRFRSVLSNGVRMCEVFSLWVGKDTEQLVLEELNNTQSSCCGRDWIVEYIGIPRRSWALIWRGLGSQIPRVLRDQELFGASGYVCFVKH